jgi:hypothetical protein
MPYRKATRIDHCHRGSDRKSVWDRIDTQHTLDRRFGARVHFAHEFLNMGDELLPEELCVHCSMKDASCVCFQYCDVSPEAYAEYQEDILRNPGMPVRSYEEYFARLDALIGNGSDYFWDYLDDVDDFDDLEDFQPVRRNPRGYQLSFMCRR